MTSFDEALAHVAEGNPYPDLILSDAAAYRALSESLRTEPLERFFEKDIPILIANDGSLDDTFKDSHTLMDASIPPMRFRSLIQRNVGQHAMSF